VDIQNITVAYETVFIYDGLGRLRTRQEYQGPPLVRPLGSGSGLGLPLTNLVNYIYDGWRVIQERDSNNVPTVSYTRGLDLSGSLEGAGGIGGLLARSSGYSSGNWTSHACYHADGNGNITCLVDGSQSLVASYRYGPFGNTVSQSGTLADANVYRFSSKENHTNSLKYYYGRRFYGPNMQRWMNRDPIAERGGLNLYRLTYNDPINRLDRFGLAPCSVDEWAVCTAGCRAKAGQWYLGVKSCNQTYLFFCVRVVCTCRTKCTLARATQEFPGVFFCTYTCLAHQPPDQMTVTIEYEEGDEYKGCPDTMADDAPPYQEP
jgi:RHS repeat-associated protein